MKIFYINSSAIKDLKEYKTFLSAEELERSEAISVAKVKANFVLGRFLIRASLSKILNCKPADIILKKTSSGRLELGSAALSFNLSHSNNIVILAVSEHQIGVDVELIKPRNFLAVAEYLFSEKEIAILKKSGLLLAQTFYSYWTLKEAFVKCNGKRILDRSAQLECVLENQKISSALDGQYQMVTFGIDEDYVASIVLKTPKPSLRNPLGPRSADATLAMTEKKLIAQKILSLTSVEDVHFPILFFSTR